MSSKRSKPAESGLPDIPEELLDRLVTVHDCRSGGGGHPQIQESHH
jgi:hypothetical protein